MSAEVETARGDCFRAAGLLIAGQHDRRLRLVHATALGQGGNADGLRYCHAWVEDRAASRVYDFSNGKRLAADLAEYYCLGQIENVHRYTPADARDHMRRSGHYGPWAPDFDGFP